MSLVAKQAKMGTYLVLDLTLAPFLLLGTSLLGSSGLQDELSIHTPSQTYVVMITYNSRLLGRHVDTTCG